MVQAPSTSACQPSRGMIWSLRGRLTAIRSTGWRAGVAMRSARSDRGCAAVRITPAPTARNAHTSSPAACAAGSSRRPSRAVRLPIAALWTMAPATASAPSAQKACVLNQRAAPVASGAAQPISESPSLPVLSTLPALGKARRVDRLRVPSGPAWNTTPQPCPSRRVRRAWCWRSRWWLRNFTPSSSPACEASMPPRTRGNVYQYGVCSSCIFCAREEFPAPASPPRAAKMHLESSSCATGSSW